MPEAINDDSRESAPEDIPSTTADSVADELAVRGQGMHVTQWEFCRQRISLELEALPSAFSFARRYIKKALGAWQLWPEVINTVELLVSELVTNALVATEIRTPPSAYLGFGGTDCLELTVRLLPSRVVIGVSDNNPNPPLVGNADLDSESGRGLMLVQALSKEWGHFSTPLGGKTVYCVVGL